MANNDDQFDDTTDEEFDTDLGFDDASPAESGRNNALMKIGLIAGGLVVVVIGIFMLGGSGDKSLVSQVPQGPVDTNAASNQQQPTQQYREAAEEYERTKIDQAKQSGDSVIPMTIDPSQAQFETASNAPQETPAERLRRIQDEYDRQKRMQSSQNQGQQDQAAAQARAQALQQMSQGMSTYLSSAVSLRQPVSMSEMDVSFSAPADEEGINGVNGNGLNGSGMPLAQQPKTILAAATIEYGQLMIEANTDAPGPVLAMIASGKLSGSRLLGTFQKTDDYLTLNFNQLITKDGRAIPIQAVALDPDTTLPGMITEIDRRYFQRYILPAAADFISGVGEAIAKTKTETTQTASSTVTTDNEPDYNEAVAEGIRQGFDGLGEAIEDQASRTQPMLRVAAGTPIGILFTQAVVDQTNAEVAQQQALQAQQQGGLMNGLPGQFQPYVQGAMPYMFAPAGYAAAPAGYVPAGYAVPSATVPTAVTAPATIPSSRTGN